MLARTDGTHGGGAVKTGSTMPPEVLHFTGYRDDHSGIHSTVAALQSTGTFRCVLGVHPDYVSTRPLGLIPLALPRVPAESIGLAACWAARRVAKRAEEWLAADANRVFHAHSRAGLLAALWLARRGCRRVVASVHCYGRQRWFYRWAARQMDGRLFWLSPAMRNHYGVTGEGWASCIPECVGLRAPAYDGVGAGQSGVTLRLGGAGLRVRWKGWDLMMRALAQLPAEVRRQIEFQQVGSTGPESDSRRYALELRALTRQCGLDDQVKWLPAEPDSRRLLAQVDAVVVASHREPMSLVMLEALAAGVPVIAADSGGAPDVIRPGTNGWLFQDGNAADLARLLADLARDRPDRRLDRGSFLPAELTAANVAARWLAVYSALPAIGSASQG